MRKPYRTDLTDAQWKLIKPLIPSAKPGGRPREVNVREVLDTLLYQNGRGNVVHLDRAWEFMFTVAGLIPWNQEPVSCTPRFAPPIPAT
jgi:Putative transposase of IS4/5 family (DUF4096)